MELVSGDAPLLQDGVADAADVSKRSELESQLMQLDVTPTLVADTRHARNVASPVPSCTSMDRSTGMEARADSMRGC